MRDEELLASQGIGKTPWSKFKSFYYDTAVGGSKAAIRCGLDVFGYDNVVYATDYPWGPNGGRDRLATYPKIIEEVANSKEERDAIMWGNLRKVLRVD